MEAQFQKDQEILMLLEQGASYRSICTALNVSQKRVSDVKKNKTRNHVKGRPRKTTDPIKDFIETNTESNAKISHAIMTNLVNERFDQKLSVRTVANIREAIDFNYTPENQFDLISDEHLTSRLAFAEIVNTQSGLGPIVFSDQARFVVKEDNVWRYINKANWNDPAVLGGNYFVAWGAIGPSYKSNIIINPGPINDNWYFLALENSKLFETSDEKFGNFNWFYLRDGPQSASNEITSNYFCSKCKLIDGWPSSYTDLNPMEIIWAIADQRLAEKEIQSQEDLVNEISNLWNELCEASVNHLVEEFARRINLLNLVHGRSITQFISFRIRSKPKKALTEEEEIPAPFTQDEDEIIIQKVEELGTKWQLIATFLGHRTRNQVKNRYRSLKKLR